MAEEQRKPSTMDYFVNPYTSQIEEVRRQIRELENAPTPPMYSPEEVARRRAEIARNQQFGHLGMISRDPAITSIAQPLLQEAIRAQQRKQTDHGEFDPISGEFRYFPQYGKLRKEERLDKDMTNLVSREAMADFMWQNARTRAQEARDLAGYKQQIKPPGAEPGSYSYTGTEPGSGQPIRMHSKTGQFEVNTPEGWKPYNAAVAPKPNNPTAGEREHLSTSLTNIAGLKQAKDELSKVSDDWHTKLTTGLLPGAIASSGAAGQAIAQNIRPEQLNKADQILTYITDGIRAGRFGLTLTPSEKASSVQYLPSQYENVDRKIAKINGLMELLQRDYDNRVSVGTQPGLPPPGPHEPTRSPTGPIPNPTPGTGKPADLPAPVPAGAAITGGNVAGPFTDPEKNRRYQEWKKSQQPPQ